MAGLASISTLPTAHPHPMQGIGSQLSSSDPHPTRQRTAHRHGYTSRTSTRPAVAAMSHPVPPSQPVRLTKAASIVPSGGQTAGMVRSNAIVDQCDGICATHMLALPRTASAVHHHGPQDTVVYAVRGRGSVVSEGGARRLHLEPGDFALIPAFAEHQEVNDSDEEVVWAIVRSGRVPVVVNLTGWNGEPVEG
ncbi:hypothetical protein GGS23DRAFT_587502 [Durotheca rogersii]|uniref:uncharacterized protein n=1 Tax=Durotheca rogersii TaxID=419775 RepID=UPI00222072B9|nr:uncharacterized protein GGS23DRAFT_587502 [Durotheca rogersii]KAI5857455.1 hypothetical protein GGS23DRAFT_587502 [Durotheca rogersii]